MRVRIPRCAAVLGAMVLCIAALGSTRSLADVNLHEVVTFGDSLTDNQSILPIYTGLPPTLYGHDPMQLVFDKNRRPSDELSNYAVAGFTSDLVDLQVELYEFNKLIFLQDRGTLYQLEMGGNDVLNNDFLLARNAPGTNVAADGVINNILDNFEDYLIDLQEDARFDAKGVIWTLPDISLTPRYFNVFTAQEQANIRAHTERVNTVLRGLDRFADVVVLDVYMLLAEIVNNPPTIRDITLGGPPQFGQTTDIFADEIHPTAVSNAILANELIALMNDKWDAGFASYTEDELYDFAINGGWNPAPGGLLVLAGFVCVLGRRRGAYAA